MEHTQEKGKLGAGGGGAGAAKAASSLLMDPFFSAHANDEEVKGMLDRFKVRMRLLAFLYACFIV